MTVFFFHLQIFAPWATTTVTPMQYAQWLKEPGLPVHVSKIMLEMDSLALL